MYLRYLCMNLDTLPQVYRVVAPFTPFDTMYIDSQYSGTRKRLMFVLTSLALRRLASAHICSRSYNRRCMIMVQSRAEQSV